MQNYHPIETVPSLQYSRTSNTTQQQHGGGDMSSTDAATTSDITEAMQFVQTAVSSTTTTPGTNKKSYPKITCFLCGNEGHYADFCPDRKAKQRSSAIKYPSPTPPSKKTT